MARICFTLDDSTDEKISKICEQHNMSKSAWCASAIEAFMRQSDQTPDQLTDPERVALQQRITTLEASQKECEQVRENLREDLQALRISSAKELDQLRISSAKELDQLRISSATLEERVKSQDRMLEERVKSQGMLMDELRARATQAEGIVQTLMAERQALLPQKAGFWSRLFGKG